MVDQDPAQHDPAQRDAPQLDATKPKSPSGARKRDFGGVDDANSHRITLRLASAGLELATSSLVLGGAGYALDTWLGSGTPVFGIIGLMTGFSLGFYRLIALANRINP